MFTVSLKSMQLSKGEEKSKEKLIKILEQEFSFKLVGDNIITEGHYEEHIKLYQVYTTKKGNARGAGRKKTGKQQAICNCAIDNPHYSIKDIADYFDCSRQYVSRVLKENKVREKKRLV